MFSLHRALFHPGAAPKRADRAANGDSPTLATSTRQPAAGILHTGALLGLIAALLAAAPEAEAQCVQTGTNVSCTGTDPDGFAAAEDGLTITVQPGATVENGGTGGAVTVQGSSALTVEAGATLSANGVTPRGAEAQGSGDTLTNRGDILVSGSGAVGVQVGTVVNESTGRIIVAPAIGGGAVTGINGGAGRNVTNDGLVQVSGAGSTGIATATQGVTTNTGTIRMLDANAIGVSQGALSQLTNSGLIESTGDGGIGIRLNGASAFASNDGTIRTGPGGIGVLANSIGSPQSPNRFNNLQNGLIETGAGGVAVQGSIGVEQVGNLGTIQGDVRLGAGGDFFGWGAGSSVSGALDGGDGSDQIQLFQADPAMPMADTYDLGAAQGFELLRVGAAGSTDTWTLTGSGAYADGIQVEGGTARVASGAAVQNELRILDGEALFADGATFASGITVTGGTATFEDGASVQANVVNDGGAVRSAGVSTLQGDLTIASGASYRASFDPATSSRLDVQGSVNLQPGANLVLSNSQTLAIVQSYRILTATAGVTGQFDVGSAFQRITPTYGPTTGSSFVDVLVESTFTLPARSANERRLGQHLDLAAQNGPDADMAAALSDLASIVDPDTARNALDALQPEFYDSATSASFETARSYAGLLAERPLRCESFVSPYRRDRPSLEPCSARGLTPWAAGFGRYARRDGTSDHVDWSYGGGGLAFGADQRVGDDLLVSGMLGTSRLALDYDGDGDASLTSFEAGLGATWRIRGTRLRGVVEYGHGWHQSRRRVDFPGVSRLARASYDSNRVTGLVEVSHRFVWAPFELEPVVSAEYTWLREEAFRETSAGVVGLDVASRENALFATNAGVRAGMTLVKWYYAGAWLEWADGVWRPEIAASWRQVWNDYDRALSSRLEGAPPGTPSFRTEAQDAEYGADLAASVSFQPQGSRNTIELGYEGFIGDRTMVHSVVARFRMPF